MRDTGGPLEQLDASLDSLVPLWSWFVAFWDAGLPGVPAQARPDDWIDDGVGVDVPDLDAALRSLYAADDVGHYLHLVLRRLDPTAHWAVFPPNPRFPPNRDQHVGIRVRPDVYVIPTIFLGNMVGGLRIGLARERPPTVLREVLLRWVPDELHHVRLPPGPPVLTDLTAPDGSMPRWTPPARLLVPQQSAPVSAGGRLGPTRYLPRGLGDRGPWSPGLA